MILWLLRREQILAHRTYINWRLQDRPPLKDLPRAPLPGASKLKKDVANTPNVEYLTFAKAERLQGELNFQRHFSEWALKAKYPLFSTQHVKRLAETYVLPFRSVNAFHRLRFWHPDALDREGDLVWHAQPTVTRKTEMCRGGLTRRLVGKKDPRSMSTHSYLLQ